MSRFSPSSPSSSAPLFDEAEEAREYDAFFQKQDPTLVAAVEWHTRLEAGLSHAEQDDFKQWLASNPAHAKRFHALDTGIAALRALSAESATPLHTAPASASVPSQALQPSGSSAQAGHGQAQTNGWARGWSSLLGAQPRRAWLAFCGVGVLAVGLGWQHWDAQRVYSQQYVVARGQGQTVTLPDGSELAFDAQTQAEVTFYPDRREVRLKDGQIMFTVAPNKALPFEVLAGSARVTVVGTQFSVRYRSDGIDADRVKVAVGHGHVRVANAHSKRPEAAHASVDLVAGQGLTVSGDGSISPVSQVAVGSIAPWRNGLVRFENTPLGDALKELERYGATGLTIRDPVVAAMPIGGSFQTNRPEAFAHMVTQILPVKLVKSTTGTTEMAHAP